MFPPPTVPCSSRRRKRIAVRSTGMVLAHQGGWDEILLVLVPIVVVGWLLWLAKRRVSRAAGHDADHPVD